MVDSGARFPQHDRLWVHRDEVQAGVEFVGWLVEHGYVSAPTRPAVELAREWQGVDSAELDSERARMPAAARETWATVRA